MVRETRHLWVGNLPDNIREEKIVEHFARYGRVESAKLTGKRDAAGAQSAFVDFVDINSATKAHDATAITIAERDLQIEYNNPDSPTEIHTGESGRDYDLQPGRIQRYDNRRGGGGGTVEERYDPSSSNYEFDRTYDRQQQQQHYGHETPQYRGDESGASPAYRDRPPRERTVSRTNFYQHSRSSDQYENTDPDYLKDTSSSYVEPFGDATVRKSRVKTPTAAAFKTLSSAGQSKSPSARSGSGSGRKSRSNSRSRSRSRSKSTNSRSSGTGSEDWSRRSHGSRDRDSDRESRNTETTQSSIGGTKYAGLCVRNLPARSSDSSIKDGLFHEFKKYGQVTAVTVQGSGDERKGIVFFKRSEDMEKAMQASRGNSFFGCEMSLSQWDGAGKGLLDLGVDDSEVKYFEKELDEYHPRATRTLFVGNLDRSVTRDDLDEAFHKFGEIVHIEIKKPQGAQPFAFLQFSDIDSVVRARKKLDGEYVGKNKLGFGKSMATNCVWLDNLSQSVSQQYLLKFCNLRFGPVSRVVHDRRTNMALVFFFNVDHSQKAVQDLKIGSIMGRRPKVDFASRECQNHFYDRMEQTGQAGQAPYYNHSRETSPSSGTFTERPPFTPKNTSSTQGEFRANYTASTPFEGRRTARAPSSSSFSNKYSGGGHFEERYQVSNEDGYHERHFDENYTPIRSSSYDGDDYQRELREYGYHQKERTKEQFRDRSSSPTSRERGADGRSKSLSVEPVGDGAMSPPCSPGEDGHSPSSKRPWIANSLAIQNSKEGSSTPMPPSPFSEEDVLEEPSWKTRNGNSSSERGSSLDRSDVGRKAKTKVTLDIPRDDDLVNRKKKVPSQVSLDKSPNPYLERTSVDNSTGIFLERLKVDSGVHSVMDSNVLLLHVDGESLGPPSRTEKLLKDKKSPRGDFVQEKSQSKCMVDVIDTTVSLAHELDGIKRRKFDDDIDDVCMDDLKDVPFGETLQKKLQARKQRFSDNNPVIIHKKEKHSTPKAGKVPNLGKGSPRDSEYIPKGDSFIGDSRTVEDSHSSVKEGTTNSCGSSNGGSRCEYNDQIGSFWWMEGQKLYSDNPDDDAVAADRSGETANISLQPYSSETVVGAIQAALDKPKKSLQENSDLSQDRTRKRGVALTSSGQQPYRVRIPLNDMDEGIASSSDQETPGSEEELVPRPATSSLIANNSHSKHSSALPSLITVDGVPAATKVAGAVDAFEKPQIDSKQGCRKQMENARKAFEFKQQQQVVRQRHPSHGEGQQQHPSEGKPDKGSKGGDEWGRSREPHNSKRKDSQGTIIQDMEWKMIPLDPICFPPSGRREQIDTIYANLTLLSPPADMEEAEKLGPKPDRTEPNAAGGLLDNASSDQYSKPLGLHPCENDNFGTEADQLPMLSPKPVGTNKPGTSTSPPASAPQLSPAITPKKAIDDTTRDHPGTLDTTTKLPGYHKACPNLLLLPDGRNCGKTLPNDFGIQEMKEKPVLSSTILSTLTEKIPPDLKGSYLRLGEGKVSSWLRQMPSPTLCPVENSIELVPNQKSPYLTGGINTGSPSMPITPSTPSTPVDGKLGEVVPTKLRVGRLSNCRIIKKKDRSSVDLDRSGLGRNDKKTENDDLIKYFQARMQQSQIFDRDEARLSTEQTKAILGTTVTPVIKTSGSVLAKSKSEDINSIENIKLNRSNSDPRMASGAKLLSLPKTVDGSVAGLSPFTSGAPLASGVVPEKVQTLEKNDVGAGEMATPKSDQESIGIDCTPNAADVDGSGPTTTESREPLTSPSLVSSKDGPKLKSILKKRTESDDTQEGEDADKQGETKKDSELRGVKRKRSTSPVSGDGMKTGDEKPEKLVLLSSPDGSEKKSDNSSVPTTPKFQHPTNMLFLSPKELSKKSALKPRSKPKSDKINAASSNAKDKKLTEKSPSAKKDVIVGKKDASRTNSESNKTKFNFGKDKLNTKSTAKKVEKKEEKKSSDKKPEDKKITLDRKQDEKKLTDRKQEERKSVSERKEEKKPDEPKSTKRNSENKEKVMEKKGEERKDGKKEEKNSERKDDSKRMGSDKKGDKRVEERRASDKKGDDKKPSKRLEEKKSVKEVKVDDKKGPEKRSSEKKGGKVEEKKGTEKKKNDKKVEKRSDDRRGSGDRKGEEKRGVERKADDKKSGGEKKGEEKKPDKLSEDKKVGGEKKLTDGKKEKQGEERRSTEKKLDDKKSSERKNDRRAVGSSVSERKKADKGSSEKSKETKSSDKGATKKVDDRNSELKGNEKDKAEKPKPKGGANRRQQSADSADPCKQRKPTTTTTKEGAKTKTKSEDRTKTRGVPGTSGKSSSSSRKEMKKSVNGAAAVSGVGVIGPPGVAGGGGVKALIAYFSESESSGSDDEFECFITNQVSSSSASPAKPKKAPIPAKTKFCYSSSDDESDSDTAEARNSNTLKKLLETESLSDSDDDVLPKRPMSQKSSKETDEKFKSSSKNEVSNSSGREQAVGKRDRLKESKKARAEREQKEVEKVDKKSENVDKPAEDTAQAVKPSLAKKADHKIESKVREKSVKATKSKRGFKEGKSLKTSDSEKKAEKVICSGKVKRLDPEKDKVQSKREKLGNGKESECDDGDPETSEQTEDKEQQIVEDVQPEVKAPKEKSSKKGGRSRVKARKGTGKPRSVGSKERDIAKECHSETGDLIDDAATVVADVKPPVEAVAPPEQDKNDIKEDELPEDSTKVDVSDKPPEEDLPTETVDDKTSKERSPVIKREAALKKTKTERSRKKRVNNQYSRKVKKRDVPPPKEEEVLVVPDVIVHSESNQDAKDSAAETIPRIRTESIENKLDEKPDAEKSDADKFDAEKFDAEKSDAEKSDAEKSDAEKSDAEKSDAEKSDAEKSDAEKSDAEKSDAEKSDAEMVVKTQQPSVGDVVHAVEESSAKILDECTDAEKAKAMFEETAEATAALELVEMESSLQERQQQERQQQELIEEIFGDEGSKAASSLPPSPLVPSPLVPSPLVTSPLPGSQLVPFPLPGSPLVSSLLPPSPMPSPTPSPVLSPSSVSRPVSPRPSPVLSPSSVSRPVSPRQLVTMTSDPTPEPTPDSTTATEMEEVNDLPVDSKAQDENIVAKETVVQDVSNDPPSKPEQVLEKEEPVIGPQEIFPKELELEVEERAADKSPVILQAPPDVQGDASPTMLDATLQECAEPKIEPEISAVKSEAVTHETAENIFRSGAEEAPGAKFSTKADIEVSDTFPEQKSENTNAEVKLADINSALGGLEYVPEETASVEVTTETASEANESLVIAQESLDTVSALADPQEKAAPLFQLAVKSKKKKEHKKKKHKNRKKESNSKGTKRKKKKKSKDKTDRKSKKQKTGHKSSRHRSHSNSSFSTGYQLDNVGSKNIGTVKGQATPASVEPGLHPGGLTVQKVENPNAVYYPEPPYYPGKPMYPYADSLSAYCGPIGWEPSVMSYAPYPGQLVDASRQQGPLLNMLSPNSSADEKIVLENRHSSGKKVNAINASIIHTEVEKGVMPKDEYGIGMVNLKPVPLSEQIVVDKMETEEAVAALMQNNAVNEYVLGKPRSEVADIGAKDISRHGQFDVPQESQAQNVPHTDHSSLEKCREGVIDKISGGQTDIYDFIEDEKEPATATSGIRPQHSQVNASRDVYDFDESPGTPTKPLPATKAAGRGRRSTRRLGRARARVGPRGGTKDTARIKEEPLADAPAQGDAKKMDVPAFPYKVEVDPLSSSASKVAVAELVPSSESKVLVGKSEDPGVTSMPPSLPNTGALAGVLPIVALSQADNYQNIMPAASSIGGDHIMLVAHVPSAASSISAAVQQSKLINVHTRMPVPQSKPSVSMPAVVAALNTPSTTPKLQQHPVAELRAPVPQSAKKQRGKTRSDNYLATVQHAHLQQQQHHQQQQQHQQHQQQIRNFTNTDAAVEEHFKESLKHNNQSLPSKQQSPLGATGGSIVAGQPVGMLMSLAAMNSSSRDAPAITSQLMASVPMPCGAPISRSPAVAVSMKSGPITVPSVPGSHASPDISPAGVTRSGIHPNLPPTLVSVPPTSSVMQNKRQQPGVLGPKYECRVPTSVAATSFPDASVLRARLTQNEVKHRIGDDGKLLPNHLATLDNSLSGPYLPAGFIEKGPVHINDKSALNDPTKPGIVPTEQRLASAFHDAPIVYYNPRGDPRLPFRGPGHPPAMFPLDAPVGPGMANIPIPNLVHPGMELANGLPQRYGIPFPGPFPQALYHPIVHTDQTQPLTSPRGALASPRMVVPAVSSPRLSPQIKSPGIVHADRSTLTPDRVDGHKQGEIHGIALRHPGAPQPGISTGIPPGMDHPEMHNLAHRFVNQQAAVAAQAQQAAAQAQQSRQPKTEQLDKQPAESCLQQQMGHVHGPAGQHGMTPHVQQQLPSQNMVDHGRTASAPRPEGKSPGIRAPPSELDGRSQQLIQPNSASMKGWPLPGISPHTPITTPGPPHPASPMPPPIGGDASSMMLHRYPVMWQGMLALKQEIATIQLHYICGNKGVATDSLKMAYPPLRIAQRMRLEDSQLEGVARRMKVLDESVVLLALPCGSDQDEVMNQTSAMRTGLISYLREKQAAGIINVGPPGCTDPSFVIHIFPPCEFTQSSLSHKAPDLLQSVMNLAYMMFVIATC